VDKLEKFHRSWVIQIFASKNIDGKEKDILSKGIVI